MRAAQDLVYRQGVARTSLADIASTAEVPLGNIYYYFKTKDDIVDAVVQSQAHQIGATLAEFERRHRSPKARLKALVRFLADHAEATARYGCPHGGLSSELAKQADAKGSPASRLMQIQLDWAEQQFRAMRRRDARDLAVQLLIGYQGGAVLTNVLGEPGLMARQARRLEKWIDSMTYTDRSQP